MLDPYGPPTEKQVRYAHDLGIKFNSTTTKSGLSAMISMAKANLPPSKRKLEFARSLGVKFDPHTTDQQLGKLIDAALARESRKVLSDNSALKVDNIIMHKQWPYRITKIDRRNRRQSVSLDPFLSPEGMRRTTVKIVTLAQSMLASERELQAALEFVQQSWGNDDSKPTNP